MKAPEKRVEEMNELNESVDTGTEQSAGARQRHPVQRSAILLVIAVFIGGGIFSWCGTRGGRGDAGTSFSDETTRLVLSNPAEKITVDPNDANLVFERGAAIQQLQCAGCHAPVERLSGPPYQQIAKRYRAEFRGETDALSALAVAVNHPPPGWSGYAAAAPNNLADADRRAAAYWILRSTAEQKGEQAVK